MIHEVYEVDCALASNGPSLEKGQAHKKVEEYQWIYAYAWSLDSWY